MTASIAQAVAAATTEWNGWGKSNWNCITGIKSQGFKVDDSDPRAQYILDHYVSLFYAPPIAWPTKAEISGDDYAWSAVTVSYFMVQGGFAGKAILRNRVPRSRKDLEDLAFTADVIFPGGLNPRLEELICAVNPYFEVVEMRTQRESYGKTTGEWLRRLRLHEKTIRAQWGDQVFVDYERYLDTCVRAFAAEWSSDVQMKLRWCKA
jgi:hypothetical protein